MNLALFFEGTGQGVHGRKTNVSLVYECCRAAEEDEERGQRVQLCHLENGPGAKVGSWLIGGVAGVGWRVIFARARRWFEQAHSTYSSPSCIDRTPPKVFLFGFSRGALLARHFAAWLDKLGIAVEYLGLWDTVDATPGLEVSEACPANVKRARHAVAEHEARRFFRYVPLGEGELSADCPRTAPSRRIEEELFPGCHSDVGGLYEDDHTLADLAREWVLEPALAAGLIVGGGSAAESETPPGERLLKAVRHDSLRLASNLWGLLKPRLREFPATMKHHEYGIMSAERR